jgi:hypothetical protein
MGRYMTELGMTPASRSRVAPDLRTQLPQSIEFRTIYEAKPASVLLREQIDAMSATGEAE